MLQEMPVMSSGGGGISPTLVDTSCVARVAGTLKTYTVDATKSYFLYTTFKYNDGTFRSSVYYINKGSLTQLTNTETQTALTVSISGTTVTISVGSTYSNYYDFTLVQLD